MNELESILNTATQIAEQAAEIAQSYFRQAILIEMKENMTPVTVADKKTEEFIRKELASAFPGFGICGEEFGEEGKEQELVWTVDPIDGTKSFIKGIPLFGTLLGLLQHGEPIMGVMVLPALKETYTAAKDLGTYCNGHQLHVSQKTSLESSFVSIGDIDCFEASRQTKGLHRLLDKAEFVRGYTDCFGHSCVMRGGIDAMIDPVVSLWDIAPLACLIKEAGGEYFSLGGSETIHETSFITCGPGLKKEILSILG